MSLESEFLVQPQPPFRTLNILAVEDHDLLLEYAAVFLRLLGHNVYTATTVNEAIGVLQKHPEVDLVFSDIRLAGPLSGRDLADAMATDYPRVRALLTSGYESEVDRARRAGIPVISKPYSGSTLRTEIDRLFAPQISE